MRLTSLCLILAAVLHAQEFKDVNKTVPLSPQGSVLIENHKGSIHVTVWDRPDVDIKARIEPEIGSPMDRRRFDATDVLIDSSADSVRIRTRYPDSSTCCFFENGNNPLVRYTIQMPRTARLTIRDHRSDTDVSDLRGALDINTHRGTVQVHRLAGPLQLSTHRGDVKVDFTSFAGDSSVETHRGSIELSLPRNSAFEIHSSLDRHAVLDSDFPIVAHAAASRHGAAPSGTVNGGGPVLRLNTFRGHIRLRSI